MKIPVSRSRLPEEAREKLRKGGTHRDRKRYDRKRDKVPTALDKIISNAFFVSLIMYKSDGMLIYLREGNKKATSLMWPETITEIYSKEVAGRTFPPSFRLEKPRFSGRRALSAKNSLWIFV